LKKHKKKSILTTPKNIKIQCYKNGLWTIEKNSFIPKEK
jgi:DNA polymerase IIIc chi subunit